MTKLDLYIADKYLSHQIDLLRFAAGEQNKILALLKQMQVELKAKLRNGLTDFSKARVNKMLKEVTDVIDDYYKAMAPGKAVSSLPNSKELRTFLAKNTKKLLQKGYTWAEGSCGEFAFGVKNWLGDTVELINVYNKEGVAMHLVAKVGDKYIDGAGIHSKKEVLSGYFKGGWLEKVSWEDYKYATSQSTAKELGKKLSQGFGQTQKGTDMLALAKNEAKFTVNTFAGIGLDASLPSEAALKALVNGSLIEGAKSSAWWARQSEDLQFKFASQVRQGIAQNETLQQIIRRVAGSKRLGVSGIMDVSRRNASALVHTSIMQVANDARLATFRANDDIIKGMRFLATLDSHTSLTCIAHSGAEWDMKGNPIVGNFPFEPPPLHFNCRSMLVPITISYRELGIDVDKPKGTRASDLGQIPSDTTFDGFLKRHDAAYVDDLLGPGRAKLWRDGKITLQDLLSQTGRPLTLDQLRGKR